MKYFLKALTFSFLLSLISCGGGGSSKTWTPRSSPPNPVVIDLDASIDGQYLAAFETLNHQITTKITGAFTFSRDLAEDELIGDIRITNAGAGIIHAQNVRVGRRCPTTADDTNADGIIDAREGEAVYGNIFFPLDGDINSQSSHDGEFPVGDQYGNYIWARAALFTHFMKDLRSQINPDGYFKLKPNEPLGIEGRVVIIHGVDTAVALPETVMGVGRLGKHQTLPIACGVIQKVMEVPGEIEAFAP